MYKNSRKSVLIAAALFIITGCGLFLWASEVHAEEARVELTINRAAEEEEGTEDETEEVSEESGTASPTVPDTGANETVTVGAVATASVVTIVIAVAIALAIRTASAKPLAAAMILMLGGIALAPSLTQPEEKEAKDLTLVSEPAISMAEIADAKIALIADSLSGIGVHELKVKTNSPDGYTVSINTKTEETSLTSKTTSDIIKSIDGTVSTPKILTENTWGFSTAAGSEAPTIGSKWAGVTVEPVVFYESDQPNYEAEALNVYFAANVSEDTADGTYENTVVYTILAKTDPTTIPAPTIETITPDFGAITGDTRVTIVGENYTKNGNSITTKVMFGNAECTDVEVYADVPETGKDTIICTAPAHDGINDRVGVKVETWGGEAVKEQGFRYDISDIVYVTPDIASTTAGAAQGPAFTIYGSGFIDEEYPVTKVTIGGIECEEFTIVSSTQITCTKGPNSGLSAGTKRVLVHHQGGLISGGVVNVEYYDTNYPVFSDNISCTTTKTIYRDVRDSQLYYVARMADGKCWMVDNLKYTADGAGTLAQVENEALSADKTSNSTAGNYEVAKYVDPNTQNYCMETTNMPAQTVTRCGMLYNWYAATDGTGVDTMKVAGEQASESICPAGMRLPSSISTATTDYGKIETFADADYPILVASLNEGSITSGVKSDNSRLWQAGVLPTGDWAGVYTGFWGAKFVNVGRQGYYWSSSVATKTDGKLRAHYLSFHSGEVRTGDASYANDTRSYGFAVRCVEE